MSDANRRTGRSIGAVAAFTLASTGLVALPAGATLNEEEGTITLDIVAISDFHGHIENAAALDNMIKEIKANNESDTIFAANGDNVGGSAYISAIDNDNPTMEILTAMGLQVSSVGNHEFDKGYEDFIGRIAPTVGWPYLVTNVNPIDNRMTPPYEVITTDSGVRVGFIGAVTDQLATLVNPAGIEGLEITDPVAAVDAQAALLKDGDESNDEADVVVALIHETAGISKNVGANVDAVVAGHTHHDEEVTTATGAPVIEPGSYGQAFAHFTLTVDADSKQVINADAALVEVPAMDCKATPEANPDICGLFADADENATALGAEPVGTIVGGADRATNNGEAADLGANRGSEMTAANLIAQAFYEYSQGMARLADFGLMNPGGVRAEIDANRDGVVTLEESFSAQPFGNDYGIVDISAAQVYTMLEQQWADASTQTSRPMLQLGISDSLYYTYDIDAEFGSHIKQVYINGELVDREDTETMFTVASNSFLVGGGDGFNVFKDGQDYLATGIIDNDVFNEFLTANPGLVVDYSQRGIAISGDEGLVAGQPATIELASLSMTFGTEQQPLPTVAEIYLGGQKVGEGTIDNTVTPNLDYTGKATASFTVPAGLAPGVHELTIVAGPTSATVSVEIADAGLPDEAPLPGTEGNVLFAPDWVTPIATHANTIDPAERIIVADTDNDGVDTFVLKNGDLYTFLDTNRVGTTRESINFAEADDYLVMGDVNGDGSPDLALRKAGTNEINIHFHDGVEPGEADLTFHFGRPDDVLLIGDWDGDGVETLAVKRGNTFYVKNELSGGTADQNFTFGRADDKALAGDFDGDGVDTISVERGNRVFLKNELGGGIADSVFTFGRATDVRVVGDFFGTGTDTLAIVRW